MTLRTPLLLSVLLVSAGCHGVELTTGAAYLNTNLRGDAALGPSTGSVAIGERLVDLDGDAGLEDRDSSVYMFGEAVAQRWRLHASAFRRDDAGNGTLPAGFGDIPAGTPVAADIDLTNIRVALTYDVVSEPGYWVGLGVAGDYFDWDLDVVSHATLARESVRSDVLVPMPYVRAGFTDKGMTGTLAFGGMGGDLGDGDGTWLDFEAMLSYRVTRWFEVLGGYRWARIDGDGVVDGRAYIGDFDLSGWFVGGALHFGGAEQPRATLY